MARFWLLNGIVIVTAIALWGITSVQPHPTGLLNVWGMPVIGGGSDEVPAWIAMTGRGVIVLGAGIGIVAYTIYGAGLLFATGQVAAGLISFAQAGIGLVFFCCQLGFGFCGLGQLAVGGQVIGQGQLGFDGSAFLERLNKDLTDLLRFSA